MIYKQKFRVLKDAEEQRTSHNNPCRLGGDYDEQMGSKQNKIPPVIFAALGLILAILISDSRLFENTCYCLLIFTALGVTLAFYLKEEIGFCLDQFQKPV